MEKDNIVHSIREDEYRRSQEVVKTLHAKAGNYPKSVLIVLNKQRKGKEYMYHFSEVRPIPGNTSAMSRESAVSTRGTSPWFRTVLQGCHFPSFRAKASIQAARSPACERKK